MFKRQKPPKHILFIGEKTDIREYIIDIIKESVREPKEKVPKYTFSTKEPLFDQPIQANILERTDGAIFLVDSAKTADLSTIKEYLWEMFVWDENTEKIPALIVSYNADKAIALTISEIIEAFSLIRLTDRLWNVLEVRENKSENILACFKWLDDYIDVLGVKPKQIRKKRSSKSKKG